MLAEKLEKKKTQWINLIPSHICMVKCYETYLAWPVPGPSLLPLVSKDSSTRSSLLQLEPEVISGDHLDQHQERLVILLMYMINYEN